MTEKLFFDTDCISAFLWVRNESILAKMYPGKIVIPMPVYTELSRPNISHLKERIDNMLANGEARIQDIKVGTAEYTTYYQLTEKPENGHKVIGKGEAASISLAKHFNGVVASNNLKDIDSYISEFELTHTTTADILVEAYDKGLITEEEGNEIWAKMLKKRRRLGGASFSEYLTKKCPK